MQHKSSNENQNTMLKPSPCSDSDVYILVNKDTTIAWGDVAARCVDGRNKQVPFKNYAPLLFA